MKNNNFLALLNFYKIIGVNSVFIQNYIVKKPIEQVFKKKSSQSVPFKESDNLSLTIINNIKDTTNILKPVLEISESKNIISTEKNLNHITSLAQLKIEVENFNGCSLKDMAQNTVFGAGSEKAEILLIGEAPGSEEDELGEPFVGDSGKLLMKAISYIGLNRENVFITNRVFWRPPGNRTPSIDELNICQPFVFKIIDIIKPKIIICVGKTATTNILDNSEAITNQVGKWFDVKLGEHSYNIRAIYHPAYLIRQPSKKAILWSDLLDIQKKLKKAN